MMMKMMMMMNMVSGRSGISRLAAWILNTDISPVSGYVYRWIDTELWTDANIWKD